MSTQFEDYAKWSETAMGSIKELQDITTKAIEKLMEQQMSLVNNYLEVTTKQMSAMSEAKGYDQLVSSQASMMSAYSAAFIDTVKRATDVMNESKDQYNAWLSKTLGNRPL